MMQFARRVLLPGMIVAIAFGARGLHAGSLTAVKDEKTAEVLLANDQIRVRFHHPGPGQFGIFPKGYTGYAIDMKKDGQWVEMASAPYYTAFSYRSGWGRDWLAYVIPQAVEIQQQGDSAEVVFKETKYDFDRVRWDFTFRFKLKAGQPAVDVTYTAVPDARRELLLFWGPRLYAGQNTFGAKKDEALFAGLEYLGPQDRSSANPALAPDARMWFVPTPAKITIPLMCIVHDSKMVGLTWDPNQAWMAGESCPSALFASPNWLEDQENHLIGLFAPSVPKYVAENGLKAHTPAVVQAGQSVSITATIFAAPGRHVVDAIDLYLSMHGGLPERPPIEAARLVEMLVRALTTTAFDEELNVWPAEYGPAHAHSPRLQPMIQLVECASLIKDPQLAGRAREIATKVLASHPARPLSLSLRVGNLNEGLRLAQADADRRLKSQNPDGSWSFVPTNVAEGGLASLNAPPQPGSIAPAGAKSQGITAGQLAPLMGYVLITGDEKAWQASLKGLQDLERYAIPYPYLQPECPQSPSLHGSYYALRSCLIAYRMTGERRYLDRAVYWAKTGLPFIYLWSLPPREVMTGQVHTAVKTNPAGEQLYADKRRDVMLYGGLYGYGSSQFSHHWFGILVQWIPLVYACDVADLADYDQSCSWKRIAEGIVASAAAQMFDQPPFTGFLPDAFSLDSWTPSGPAISPSTMLAAVMRHYFNRSFEPRTAVAGHGDRRCHITTVAPPGEVRLSDSMLTFTLNDPLWPHNRAIIAGVGLQPAVTVDGRPLPRVDDLESQEEGWSVGHLGLTLLKVKQLSSPRRVAIRF